LLFSILTTLYGPHARIAVGMWKVGWEPGASRRCRGEAITTKATKMSSDHLLIKNGHRTALRGAYYRSCNQKLCNPTYSHVSSSGATAPAFLLPLYTVVFGLRDSGNWGFRICSWQSPCSSPSVSMSLSTRWIRRSTTKPGM